MLLGTLGQVVKVSLGLSVRRETAREYPEISRKVSQALRTVPQALVQEATVPR